LSLVSEQDQPAPVPSEDEDVPDAEEPGASDADEPEDLDELEERRYPSTIGGAFYLLILSATGVGVGIVASGDWRLGIRCMGGGLCFAAICRLVLPNRDAGMLAVRSRMFDALILAGLGLALFFLASTIPDQPA
jgi:hypothetical protein